MSKPGMPRLDILARHGDYPHCINDRAHIGSYTTEAMAAFGNGWIRGGCLEAKDGLPTEARSGARRPTFALCATVDNLRLNYERRLVDVLGDRSAMVRHSRVRRRAR